MRRFDSIAASMTLTMFLDAFKGALYVDDPLQPTKLVRHFDGTLPVELVSAFVAISDAANAWITAHPEIAEDLLLPTIEDQGDDYIIRPFVRIFTSVSTWDELPESERPPELNAVRASLKKALGQATTPRDMIVERVIRQTLLGLTAKVHVTAQDKVEIAEYAIEPEDLLAWATLSATSTVDQGQQRGS